MVIIVSVTGQTFRLSRGSSLDWLHRTYPVSASAAGSLAPLTQASTHIRVKALGRLDGCSSSELEHPQHAQLPEDFFPPFRPAAAFCALLPPLPEPELFLL